VCAEVEAEYRRKTNKRISLNHNTVRNLVKGGQLQREFNEEKSWLTREEAEEVITYVLECASWGHPLDHKRLKEHADELCRARLGSNFPECGVGKGWTYRFVAKHSDRL
ncbi:hypothetical protein K435DRAFT_596849, partial [Dendrothele bispora CBS 962.96]